MESSVDVMADQTIRILLADDHTVMRAGTRRILEDEPDFVVVGEAGDGFETLSLVEACQPDVVLLDIAMPAMDGIKACQAIQRDFPAVSILILTGHDNDTLVRTIQRLGVGGYLLKSAGPQELVGAIRSVCAGERVFAHEETREPAAFDTIEALRPTRKEIEVLNAVARGLKNREVAADLHLSVNTVEFHLRNLFTKLGATSRADALMRAQRLGWLDSQEPLC